MTRRASPEHAFQVVVAQFLSVALRPPVFWTAFPAGGGGKVRGARLKAAGLKAGVPDILVFAPGPHYGTTVIGIELKTPKTGRVSDAQTETHADMAAAGIRCRIARSLEDVQDILLANGIRLHARVTERGAWTTI